MSYNTYFSKPAPCSPMKPTSKVLPISRGDPFHVVHKVPVGDSPYVKAKHVQLVDKDPDRAIALFWAAINSGDRVDSALKDMAIVMRQQNRPQEAIEAIKSLRSRCSDQAQESLDNVLLDLYKRCGRLDDQIDLLRHKLHLIHQGLAFNGKRTKTARSQGKKFQVSVKQEATRLLGNLGWAYMQQLNFVAAEAVYRKALSIETDINKVCNLGICLMKQGRLEEAKAALQRVTVAYSGIRWASDSQLKSYERAQDLLKELGSSIGLKGSHDDILQQLSSFTIPGCNSDVSAHDSTLWQPQPAMPRQPRRASRSGLEQVSRSNIDPSMSGAFVATSGFGPAHHTRHDMTGSYRTQSWLQDGSCSGSSSGWDEDDFDDASLDEFSDGSDFQGYPQESISSNPIASENEEMQWHVETSLREWLEKAIALKNGLYERQLGMEGEREAYKSFPVATATPPARDMASTTVAQSCIPVAKPTQSLSSKLSRTPIKKFLDIAKPLPYQHSNSRDVPSRHADVEKQRTIKVEEEKSTWDLLDFTFNPGDLDFGRASNRFETNDEIQDSSFNREFAERITFI